MLKHFTAVLEPVESRPEQTWVKRRYLARDAISA
jgi:hypothetical protein